MSGGHFNYLDSSLKNEIFDWGDKPSNVFEDREISELVWDVLDLIHAFDWYKSGDTCKETYLKAKAEFKKKWMDNRGVRVRRIVDEALKQCKDELYETFGLDGKSDADIKPVIHSKWEITDVDHAHGHKCYHCPECGWDEWRYESVRYCPNCGVKMDGDKHESDCL